MAPPQTPNVQSDDSDIDLDIAIIELELLLKQKEEEESREVTTAPEDAAAPMTLSERAEEVVGLDPKVKRLTIVPYPMGVFTKGADINWRDWVAPQIVADMVKSALLPGHVLKGGDYNIEDVVKFTLDYALPAAQSRRKMERASDKKVVDTAPTTEALRVEGGRLLEQARRSGARIEEDDVMRLLSILEKKADLEGLDAQLHPVTKAALNYANNRLINSGGDMRSLMLARRNLGTAATPSKDVKADDLRIAQELMRIFDGFVENRLSHPEISGKAKTGRAIWGRMKRSELIEHIIAKAELSASGLERGLQSGFRSLLNNKTKLRGFNDKDKALMERIVKGGSVKQLTDWVGKFSFSSGILRGAVGSSLGFAMGGTPGAIAVPVVAQGARAAAAAATSRQAELARALVAHGERPGVVVARRPVAAPLAAALIPPEPVVEQAVPTRSWAKPVRAWEQKYGPFRGGR
jgi:hypothetical protein